MSMHRIGKFRQRGSALLISLVILLVLTLIGVSAMDTNILEEKMAGNMRDQQVAFQSAEAAVYSAESYIEGITAVSVFTGANGLLGDLDDEPDYFASSTWDSARVIDTYLPDIDTNYQPRYIVKFLGIKTPLDDGIQQKSYASNDAGDYNVFRITARGVGASGEAQAIIQTYYSRKM